MDRIRAALKLVAVVATGSALLPAQWLAVRLGHDSARHIPVVFHRTVRRIIDVRVGIHGKVAEGRPLLFAANHASWLDITIIGSLMPLCFVAKSEVEAWPIFGLLARLQRTIFVNRSRRAHTGQVASAIADRLGAGDPVVLFAEGTSSDGNRVLPFRSALLGAAREALGQTGDAFVQPMAISYVGLNGLPMGRVERPLAAWYGDMEMLPHLWGLLKAGPIDVVVAFAEPIRVDAATDRKQLASEAEARVRSLAANARRGAIASGSIDAPTEPEGALIPATEQVR
ncbi:MAG TPA: lysophospholipid acyltransferase family protein [Hyphomicrobiales bacterium]|nr:lysophospholipid acyltransferase family protein [Kaistiaceae bacterium]HQF31963.1 lysophospholipid acyltransferase family protein [Hyphomicrobiales bacterium]